MPGDGSDPAPSPYPMPGQTDFSAGEEKAMRTPQAGESPEDAERGNSIGDALNKALNMPGVIRKRPFADGERSI